MKFLRKLFGQSSPPVNPTEKLADWISQKPDLISYMIVGRLPADISHSLSWFKQPLTREIIRETLLLLTQHDSEDVSTEAIKWLYHGFDRENWGDCLQLFMSFSKIYLQDQRTEVRATALSYMVMEMGQRTTLNTFYPLPVMRAITLVFADWRSQIDLADSISGQLASRSVKPGFHPSISFSEGFEDLIDAIGKYARERPSGPLPRSRSDRDTCVNAAVIFLVLCRSEICRELLQEFADHQNSLIRNNARLGLSNLPSGKS